MTQKLNILLGTFIVILSISSVALAMEPTHIPNLLDKPLEIPVSTNILTQLPANMAANLQTLFHGSPNRLILPTDEQLESESLPHKTLYKLAPYAVMGPKKSAPKEQKLGASADGSNNTTIHGWFYVFVIILVVLAWVTHQTIKEEAKKEARKNAENVRHHINGEGRDHEADQSRGFTEAETTLKYGQSERLNMNHSGVSNDIVIEHNSGR